MGIREPLVWAFEALLKRLGRWNADDYAARHRVGFSPAGLAEALGDRVGGVDIQRLAEPGADAATVRIDPGVVQVLASLRAWKREADAPAAHETGIGIIKPVADEPTIALTINGIATCTATSGELYDCELVDDGHDTHSACGGDITWPRADLAVIES